MIGVDKVLDAKEDQAMLRREKEAQRHQRLEELCPSVRERVWRLREKIFFKDSEEEMEEKKIYHLLLCLLLP